MRPKCPNCNGDNLDQGIDRSILCHDCKTILGLYDKSKESALPHFILDRLEDTGAIDNNGR